MGKIKTSKKQRKSTMTGQIKLKKKPKKFDSMKYLLDENLIAKAIWECLRDNDPEGVIEVLEAHLDARNKSKLSRDHEIPRTTFYHAIKSKNPTLATLAKIVHATIECEEGVSCC
jgi:probable addiction module antidote protein